MNAVLIGILVYVIAQLILGVVVSFHIKTEDDYLLAGRRLGYGLATFSIFATWFGAETCVGTAGKIYEGGLAAGNAEPFGYAVGVLCMGLFFAVPLYRRGLTTIADLLRTRFSPGVEKVTVLMLAPASVMWAAAQIRAFGSVLAHAGGLDPTIAIVIATTVVIIYTASGGLLADAITDFVQGICLIIGLVVITVAVVKQTDGFLPAWQAIDPERLNLFGGDRTPLELIDAWAVPICGSLVAQELVARVLASRSETVAQRSTIVAAVSYFLIGLMPVFLGLIAGSTALNLETVPSDQVLPMMASSFLPTFLFILFSGALVSAILSTVDTALLVGSSLICHNLLIPLMGVTSEPRKVLVTRIGVVSCGLIAFGMALGAESVYDLVVEASALGTSGIFVIVNFGLFTRFGGTLSAYLTLLSATTMYAFGRIVALSGIARPEHMYLWDSIYTISLVTGLGVYLLTATMESFRDNRATA